jgi:hypothetical protein
MTNSKKNKTHQDNFHDYSEYWKENSHKITQNVQNFFENATKKMKKNSACAKENFIKERSQTLETLSETNKILMDALKTISQLQTQYVKEAFEEMQKLAKNLSVDHKPSDLKSQNDKMENMVKKNMNHAKKIGSIFMDSQKEIHSKIKDRFSQFSSNINDTAH